MMDSRLPGWIHFHLERRSDVQEVRRIRTPSSSPRCQESSVSRTSPPRSPQKAESPYGPATVAPSETLLTQYLRQGDYELALRICRDDPAQARPILQPLSPPASPRRLKTKQNTQLYYPTAVGIFCQKITDVESFALFPNDILSTMQALIKACPLQLRCSQEKRGLTPLRHLILNAHRDQVSIELVQLLLTADAELETGLDSNTTKLTTMDGAKSLLPALFQPDDDGVGIMDLVVSAIHLGTLATEKALTLLQLIVDYQQTQVHSGDVLEEHGSAILVRLLSHGTSFGYSPPSGTGLSAMMSSLRTYLPPEMDLSGRLDRILDCVRRLLQWSPRLLRAKSVLSGCTPLHTALRNYGNCDRLIRELLGNPDDCQYLVQQRNLYGDLPLHVACAVGVPMNILHLILARTLLVNSSCGNAASSGRSSQTQHHDGPNALIWSQNLAGYTPIDLEWIRHIEAGNGFFSHRSFYPLDSQGIRKVPSGRSSNLYTSLLRQAVDQIIADNSRTDDSTNDIVVEPNISIASHLVARVDWTTKSNRAFGLLLHRIFLIIRATFHDSFSTLPVDLTGDILHLAATLVQPSSLTLPRPIGELIRWQYPEELQRRDHLGRLPLHYCFGITASTSFLMTSLRLDDNDPACAKEWKTWVLDVIRLAPSACQVKDIFGRLPLHYALLKACPECSDIRMTQPIVAAITSVVEALVRAFPDGVRARDPVTGLYPYMLAASNVCLSVNTIYMLIKHDPGVSHWHYSAVRDARRSSKKRALSFGVG